MAPPPSAGPFNAWPTNWARTATLRGPVRVPAGRHTPGQAQHPPVREMVAEALANAKNVLDTQTNVVWPDDI